MLNNMDLNAKDSFYPQFDNCSSSSLGMESSVRKDNQEVYVDSERGVPAQFGHGEFASLHGRSFVHALEFRCVKYIHRLRGYFFFLVRSCTRWHRIKASLCQIRRNVYVTLIFLSQFVSNAQHSE